MATVLAAPMFGSDVVRQLLAGVSVGLFRIDGGEEGGERLALFSSTLSRLEASLPSGTRLSFGLYSVSDAHCVDMASFAQLELGDIQELARSPTLELDPVDDLATVLGLIEKGYTNSCVLLLRLRIEADGCVLCPTLAIGDLHAVGLAGGLEKSLAHLRNIALSLEQPFAGGEISYDQSRLTALLQPFIGGTAVCKVLFSLANVSAGVETRALAACLALAEALHKVKARPAAVQEAPEVRQLSQLVAAHGALETQQRETRQQARALRRALAQAGRDRHALEEAAQWGRAESAVETAEREYALARLALDNLGIQDELRQCEAGLLLMEHQRAMLQSSIYETQFQLGRTRRHLARAEAERARQEAAHDQQVAGLQASLQQSAAELASTVRRLEQQAREQGQSSEQHLAQLETRLSQAEATRRSLEGRLEDTTRRWHEERKQLGDQERRLADELQTAIAAARRDEATVAGEHQAVLAEQRAACTTIARLEREIGSLRIENASLGAKLDIYSRAGTDMKSPRRSDAHMQQAMAQIEARMAQERVAMLDLIRASVPHQHAPPAPQRPPSPGTGLTKLLARIPKKREAPRKKPAPAEPDGLRSGGMAGDDGENDDDDDAPAEAAPKGVKLKPKRAAPAATPAAATLNKENVGREPAPQLFVKRNSQQPLKVQDTPAVPPSPSKVSLKPSAFIPGIAKPAPQAAGSRSKPSFLANLSFGAGTAAASHDPSRKRIRLPERSQAGAADAAPAPPPPRKNIDPAVFSTIMSSFDVAKK